MSELNFNKLTNSLLEFKELVNTCDSKAIEIGLDVTKNAELAFASNQINRVELAKIWNESSFLASKFRHACACNKN